MEKIGLGVSIGVALAAIISSIVVALINNIYQAKLRKQELNHNLELRKQELLHERELRSLEINGEINKQNFETYYCNKRDAFNDLLKTASTYTKTFNEVQQLSSTAGSAILFASPATQEEICDFVNFALTGSNNNPNYVDDYWYMLSQLATKLNSELQSVYEENCA